MFKYLKKASGDEADIGWNFGKFLVGKDGSVIKRQVLLAQHGVVFTASVANTWATSDACAQPPALTYWVQTAKRPCMKV